MWYVIIRAEDHIIAASLQGAKSCISDNGSLVIYNGAEFVFTAGQSITLLPGFHAQMGSSFHAYLSPCSANKTDFEETEEEYLLEEQYLEAVEEQHPKK